MSTTRRVIKRDIAMTLLIALLFSHAIVFAQTHPFQNPDLDVEVRVANLLSLMTLEEKVAALSTDPSVPRLGVVGVKHIEGYHGVAMGGPANWAPKGDDRIPTTQFPQAYGMGATWDTDLIRQMGEVESIEARYLLQNPGMGKGGLVVRAPNADLGRDPRWGRTEECFGEDAFLVGQLSAAFVKGLQGDHPKYWRTAALLKHFLANSNEDGRDSSSSDFDERLFHEYYSYPFRQAIVEGGSNAYMAAYNAVNGVPAHIHSMNREIVMKQWGLNGIICTDGGGYRLLVSAHKAFPNLDIAAGAIIKAGINQFLDDYKEGVYGALDHGYLSENDIDDVLKGVYRVMIKLGQLDPSSLNPYADIGKDGKNTPWNSEKHREVALLSAQKSIVLLKNENQLPLDKEKIKKVAVIGWLADTVLLDWYSGLPPYRITPLQGIIDKVGADNVIYAADNSYNAAVEAAKLADVAIVVLGNNPITVDKWAYSPDPAQGKEGIDRKSLHLYDESLVQWVVEANPNTILVVQSSFPYAINWSQEHVPAILHMAHNGQETGSALAEVIFGDYNPAGRLTQTWPKSVNQLPPMMEYDIRKGHTYLYFKETPLYPFGFGLSYSKFDYLSAQAKVVDDQILVTVEVENKGNRTGDEVIQVYASFPNSKVERPVKSLKGFARTSFNAKEKKTVEISIQLSDLSYWNIESQSFVIEPGKVNLFIGASSADIRSTTTVDVP